MNTWILLFVLVILQGSSCSVLLFVSACYGITWSNFMSITCEAGTVIALMDVKAMAKPKSTECPQEETAEIPADESCCRYDPEDCGATYTGSVASQYYTLCHGRTSCSMLQPTWVDATFCDMAIYLDRTNYMIMEYQCIDAESSTGPCASASVTNTAVHLWNDNYPNRLQPGHDGCSCSVEASCDTTIQITSRDVRFTEDAGTCKQSIVITENEQTSHVGCETNNNYLVKTIYTSSSQFLTLEVRNALSTNKGNFWFEISASNENANLTLSCGQTKQSTQSEKQTCDEISSSTSIPPTTTTTSSSTRTTSGTLSTIAVSSDLTTINLATINLTTISLTTINLTSINPVTANSTTSEIEDNANMTSPTTDSSADNDTTISEIATTTGEPVSASPENETFSGTNDIYGNYSDPSDTQNSTTTSQPDYNLTSLTLSNESYTLTTPLYNTNSSSINNTFGGSVNDTVSEASSHSTTTEIEGVTNIYNNTYATVTGNNTQNQPVESTSGSVTTPGKGSSEDEPKLSGASTESGAGDIMMIIIIVAVVASVLIVIGIILCLNRKKLKKLLCGEKTKSQVDPETDRTDSPPKYATLPDFLFSGGGSPVITSSAAGSTELNLSKLPVGGITGKNLQLQPLPIKVRMEKRLPPVDTKLRARTIRRQHKPQKLGFLNMIMVENKNQPLPRLYPDHIEGAIRESYGASNHAVTENEVVEKARQNVNKKSRMRRKKRTLMERIHKQRDSSESTILTPRYHENDFRNSRVMHN